MLTRKRLCGLTALVVAVLIVLGGTARAEGPWKWQLSLVIKKDKQGNKMKMPTGLYVDRVRERYYVVDAAENSLHSFDLEGNYLNSLKPGDQLKQPLAMVRDEQDVLWAVEKGRNSLTRIDLKAKEITPNVLHYKGREVYPDRLELVDGNFYILDKYSGKILVFDPALQAVGAVECPECVNGFRDFAVRDGVVWALDNRAKTVYRFAGPGRKYERKFALGGAVVFPFAIAAGPNSLLYILDRHAGSIAVFDEAGEFKFSFLTQGQTRGRLYYPEDILFDYWGRLCVVDSGNGRVEIFSR